MSPFVGIYDNIPMADSREIAEKLGVSHRSFFRLISDYMEEIEEDFGSLRFEIAVKEGKRGGEQPKYALLTEDQTYALMMYNKNTEQARACKRLLVKAFAEAKQQIVALEGKQVSLLDEVQRLDQCLHELAEKQQRFLHDDGDLETTAVAIHRLTQSIGEMKAAIVKFQKTLSRTEYAQREDVAEMERTLKDAVYYVQKLQKTNELHMELQERSLDIYRFAGSALEALGQLPPGETQKQLKQAKNEDGW